MRRLLAILLGLVALILVIWLAIHDTAKPRQDPTSSVRASSTPPPKETEQVLPAPEQPSERVDATEARPMSPARVDEEFVGNTTTESLTGRVVNDLGLPVETARVEARLIGPDRGALSDVFDGLPELEVHVADEGLVMIGEDGEEHVLSEFTPTCSAPVADGAFQFEDLESGEWEFVAFGGGNRRSPPVIVEVPTNTGVTTLVLPRATTVLGRVESYFGTPLVGASLYVWYSGEDAPSFSFRAPEPRATTDERGRFLLDELMPGKFHVKADHSDYAQGEWTEVTVAPGERMDGLRLVLGSGGRIQGSVDPSLGKVAGRMINIFSFRDTEGWLDTETGEDGNFVFGNVIPQDYIIELRPEGYPFNISDESRGIRMQITVEEGETTEVVFREERPITIYGTVSSNAVLLEGARVYASPQGSVPDRQDECTTLANGAFKLVVAGPGRFWLTVNVNQGSYHFFDVTVPDTDATEFLLEVSAGRIAGTVVSPTGRPLSRVPVTLQRELGEDADAKARQGARSRMYTDDDGRFDFRFLEPGSYTIRSPDGFWRDSPPPVTPYGRVLVSDLLIDEGGSLEDVELRLTEEGRISGTVVDERGNPVQGAWVRVQDSQSRSLSSDWEVQVDASGHFQVGSLAAGVYTVVAATREDRGESTGLRVEAGKTASTTVRLAPKE